MRTAAGVAMTAALLKAAEYFLLAVVVRIGWECGGLLWRWVS